MIAQREDQAAANEECWWTTIEISEKLGVSPDRLLALSKPLRKQGEIKPLSKGGSLWWSNADLQRLRRHFSERQEQEAKARALVGLKTWEVAAEVGLSEDKVLALKHRHRIEVPRRGPFLIWTEASVAALRAILGKRDGGKEESMGEDGTERMLGRDAAKRLGITYQRLYRLVRAHSVPVKREGDRILWDEAAVSAVRKLLDQLATQSVLDAEDVEELGTIAVCRKLGIEYVTFLSLINPFRSELKLQRRGRLLLWTPEAIARVEAALELRRQKADRNLLSRTEQLKLQLKQQLVDIEETTRELSTPSAITSYLATLPSGGTHVLQFPIAVLVYTARSGFRAVLTDIELEASGPTPHKAIRNLRSVLWERYCKSREAPGDPDLAVLAQLIIPVEQG